MPRRFATWLTCLMAAAAVWRPVPAARAADNATAEDLHATFFVAADGNDAWSGRLAAPNAEKTDGPLATLEKARDALRTIDRKRPPAAGGHGPRGEVLSRQDVVLGPEGRAATRQSPVILHGLSGRKARLSGGRKVTGWRAVQGPYLRCALPGSKGGKWKFRRLFADGQPYFRPAGPSSIRKTPSTAGGRRSRPRPSPTAARPSVTSRARCPPLGKTDGSRSQRFFRHRQRVGQRDHPRRLDRPVQPDDHLDPCRAGLRPPLVVLERAVPRRGPFAVENVLEELDQPGEWCLDSEEGKLYFWPPKDRSRGWRSSPRSSTG